MTNRMNPLESLFSDKEPTDEQITAGLKGEEVEEVVEDDEDDEEGDEKPTKEAKKVDEDEDEDDDNVPDTVPKAVLLKERAKYRERIAKAEGRIEGVKEATKPKTEEVVGEEFVIPDPKEDPEGYAAYTEQRTQMLVLNERMNNSERWAIKEHGKETVDAAFAWWAEQSKTRPALAQHVRNNPDPYEECVRLYKQEQRAAKLAEVDDSEIEELRAWKKARAEGKLAEWEAAQAKKNKGKKAATPETPPVKAGKKPAKPVVEDDDGDEEDDELPPRSLASDQSARGKDGSEPGVGAGKAFDNLFR